METEVKEVTYRYLKKGQKIVGWSNGGRTSYGEAIVQESNAAFVAVLNYRKYPEQIPSEGTMFRVELTEEEFHLKYKAEARDILLAIKNKLSNYEIGEHTMWNPWISHNPYILARNCKKEKITILGICEDVYQPHRDDRWVGLCAVDKKGEKFWCHISNYTIEHMERNYAYLLD